MKNLFNVTFRVYGSLITHKLNQFGLVWNTKGFSKYYSSLNNYTLDDYTKITADYINKLVANQAVTITQAELDKLKEIPGVTFDLPLNDQTIEAFESLVGRPKSKLYKSGIYIFTHKPSGSKYVGSSNSLSRRLSQYFTFTHLKQNSGLLLPLIAKEGFNTFTLEVFVMPPEFNSGYYFLFLEQYYLLYKDFDLNSQRTVNFRVTQGNGIYLYDAEGKTLFYSSRSINQMQSELRIHPNTINGCIKTGNKYLDFFIISDVELENTVKSDLLLEDLITLIEDKKDSFLKTTSTNKFSVAIIAKYEATGEEFKFSSITAAITYLKDNDIKADRNVLSKYINSNKSYKGFLFSK